MILNNKLLVKYIFNLYLYCIIKTNKMDFEKKGKWINAEEKIRARKVEYTDPYIGKCIDAEFQVFKRPYFFGLIGKEKWITSIITNDEVIGMSFSKSLVH